MEKEQQYFINLFESLIRKKIYSGNYKPGGELPNARALAEEYKVSEATVYAALDKLEAEGLMLRAPGKGFIVTNELPIKKEFIISGGVHDIVLDASRFDVKDLEIDEVAVRETRNQTEIKRFFDYADDDSITVIKRTRYLKGMPLSYIENYVPNEIAKYLTKEELAEQPLLRILKKKMGLTIGKGELNIEATAADSKVADILNVHLFDPLILVKLNYWFPSGDPIETVNFFIKSEYFKYKVKLTGLNF